MTKIVYIADPVVLAIQIVDCGEPLVDLKNQSELAYGPPPESDLTAEYYTKVRQSVYERLCRAQKDLPNGHRFSIYEAFRSKKVQQMLFDQEYQRVSQRNPDKNHDELFYQTTRLVSPVVNLDGSLNEPPHNTGAAVDLEIINEDGQPIDMGMAAMEWGDLDPDVCLTDSKKINKNAQENRRLLVKVMQQNGFVNYPTEWWHFSYGDRYWAYHQKAEQAIYGSLE